MNSWTCDDPIRKAHLERLEDLGVCRDNNDTLNAENATRNLISGAPAFWHYGKGWARTVGNAANSRGDLISVLVDFCDDSRKDLRVSAIRDLSTEVLDDLIPLNDAAIDQLDTAYRLQSVFREDLARREERAIMNPRQLPYPHKLGPWALKAIAEAQVRFREREVRKMAPGAIAALIVAAANVEVA